MSGCGCKHTEAKVEQMLSDKGAKLSRTQYDKLWSMIGDDRIAPEEAVNKITGMKSGGPIQNQMELKAKAQSQKIAILKLKSGNKKELGGEAHVCDEIKNETDLSKIIEHIEGEHSETENKIEKMMASPHRAGVPFPSDIIEWYRDELKSHFEEEEKMLFPEIIKQYPTYKQYIDHLLEFHRFTEQLAKKCASSSSVERSELTSFIPRLRQHIKKENTLFEIIASKKLANGGMVEYKIEPHPTIVDESGADLFSGQNDDIGTLEKPKTKKVDKSTIGEEDKTKKYFREIELKMVNKLGLPNTKVNNSGAVDILFREIWDNNLMNIQEQFYVIFLDRSSVPIGYIEISKGGTDSTIVAPKMIVGIATKSLANGVIIAHNHPSGALRPSEADIRMTKNLTNALKFVDIDLLDSMILAPDHGYYSMADNGDI